MEGTLTPILVEGQPKIKVKNTGRRFSEKLEEGQTEECSSGM